MLYVEFIFVQKLSTDWLDCIKHVIILSMATVSPFKWIAIVDGVTIQHYFDDPTMWCYFENFLDELARI